MKNWLFKLKSSKNNNEDLIGELKILKFNNILDIEKKVLDMQETFNKTMVIKEKEFRERIFNWQMKEADLLKQMAKLSNEKDKIGKMLAKIKEENEELKLSGESLSLQVNEFEQLYEDTKLQIKDVMNSLTLEKAREKVLNKKTIGCIIFANYNVESKSYYCFK